MKKIIYTLIFTAASYGFIYIFVGHTGQYINNQISNVSNELPFGLGGVAMFGTVFAYVYIAFKYSRDKKLNEYSRLFFQLYSPWAITGYTVMMLFALTNPDEDFSLVFTAYSSTLFILIMIVISTNIVSFRAMWEPDSGFARLNMKLIFISNIMIFMIFFITAFVFLFNGTL